MQAFQLPKCLASGPTWVDVLAPEVVQATMTYIKSGPSSNPTFGRGEEASLPELLQSALSVAQADLPAREDRATQVTQLASLVQGLLEAWKLRSNGHWDPVSAKAADKVWKEWYNLQSERHLMEYSKSEKDPGNGIQVKSAQKNESGAKTRKGFQVGV